MGNPVQLVMLISEVIVYFLSCCIGIGPQDWSSLAGLLSGMSGSMVTSEAMEVLTNERWQGILYNWLCSFQK